MTEPTPNRTVKDPHYRAAASVLEMIICLVEEGIDLENLTPEEQEAIIQDAADNIEWEETRTFP